MKLSFFISLIFQFIFSASFAQNNNAQVDDALFGIDNEHQIIVCHLNPNGLQTDSSQIFYDFGKGISTHILKDSLNPMYSNQIKVKERLYHLYFTSYPIIHIKIEDSIVDEPKKLSDFTYAYHDTVIRKKAGIELRGNISLQFPKKSYDLEFRKEEKTSESEDVQFLDMRNDDDWILDGLYNEPLRLRSHFGNKLWQEFYKLPYQEKEPDAKSGIYTAYVEVFINNTYKGVFSLTEQVDRKLLALQKIKNGEIQGELFKASSYEGAPTFEKAPEFKNIFPHWAGYTMEFPIVDYKSHWNHIHDFTKFVIEAPEEAFNAKISQKFDLDNAINYFIFVNVLRATDNLGKNFFVAKYKKDDPYFLIPWDLDGVMGTIQDGKRIPTTNDILSNRFFDRLLKDNPSKYKDRLKNRWKELRDGILNTENFLTRIYTIYKEFENHKIYQREQIIWPSEISLNEHRTYLENWIAKRLEFMDNYFLNLE